MNVSDGSICCLKRFNFSSEEREFSKNTYKYISTTTAIFTVWIPCLPEIRIKHSPNFKWMFFHLLSKTCYCNREIMAKRLAIRQWPKLHVIVTRIVLWISALDSNVDTAVLKMNYFFLTIACFIQSNCREENWTHYWQHNANIFNNANSMGSTVLTVFKKYLGFIEL